MKKLLTVLHNVGIDTSINWVLVILSLLTTFGSIVQGYAKILYMISIVFSFSSFIALVCYLNYNHNKEESLYTLVRDNRMRTLTLLLTYNSMRNSPTELGLNFKVSKLKATKAEYTYNIVPSNSNSQVYDLNCIFSFDLCPTKYLHQSHIDVLILQPRGEASPVITYWFNGMRYTTKAKEAESIEGGSDNFNGVLWAQINVPEKPEKLVVQFDLKDVYMPENDGTMILCPFIYVKSLNHLSIKLKYPSDEYISQPIAAKLTMIPYDGSRSAPNKVADFMQHHDENSLWELELPKRKCPAQAVYVVNVYHKHDK